MWTRNMAPCVAADRGSSSKPAAPLTAAVTGLGRRLKAPPPFAAVRGAKVQRRSLQQQLLVRAAEQATEAVSADAGDGEEEFFEVNLDKPIGVKFARGNDGGAYVVRLDGKSGNIDERITPGDKLIYVSASFGDEVWEARNFGQVMYAMRTRVGGIYMKFKRNNGDMSALQEEELTEAERMWRAERAGGNYGAGTKEVQTRNYIARKEAERKRREMFDDSLALFKQGKVEEALIEFENVVSLEPKNYVGDNFSRVTDIYRVSQYNMACCYSVLDQPEPGLEALKIALDFGYEDYAKVRADPNLANLRKSPKFKSLIDKYDEPVINEEAINAIKSFFSFGKKN